MTAHRCPPNPNPRRHPSWPAYKRSAKARMAILLSMFVSFYLFSLFTSFLRFDDDETRSPLAPHPQEQTSSLCLPNPFRQFARAQDFLPVEFDDHIAGAQPCVVSP